MQRRSVWVAVGLAAVATSAVGGCAIDDVDGQQDTVAQALAVGPCGDEQCGTNSPVVEVPSRAPVSFHELSLKGVPNNVGMRIDTVGGVAQIVVGSVSYDLVVHDAHISAVRGNTVLSGTQLVGATIPITKDETHYEIAITSARILPYWVGAAGNVGSYAFEVRTSWGPVAELCNNRRLLEKLITEQGGLESDYALQELMGMRTRETLVFEGDRVDAASKTTSKDAAVDDTWINFGCAGHLLAKVLLTRNTYHSQASGLPRAWQQRQATIKVYAADYCGGGIPFTVAGQSMVYKGDAMDYYWKPKEIEARWNENGAICLNVPRLVHPSSPFGAATFPDVRRSILNLCVGSHPPPPPCLNKNPYDPLGADRVSGNPPW